MRNQILILAAGKGTRMGRGDTPKVLVGLKHKPLILHLLDELEKVNQLATPVIVVGYMANQVRDVLGDGYLYAFQKDQLGTGHAVMCAEKQVSGDNVLVLYGDMPFIKAQSLKKLMRMHHDQQAYISMFTARVPDFGGHFESLSHYGRIIRDSFGNVVKITEYKDATEAERALGEVNPGIYMFRSDWLWENLYKIRNLNAQGEYYLTDIVEVAIADGKHIYDMPIAPAEVLGVNTPEQLLAAETILV